MGTSIRPIFGMEVFDSETERKSSGFSVELTLESVQRMPECA